MAVFAVRFREDSAFEARFLGEDAFHTRFVPGVRISEAPAVYEDYAGSYDITPLITAQTLPTADKHMTDNVLVRMIPTTEIPNAAGGITFTIGG